MYRFIVTKLHFNSIKFKTINLCQICRFIILFVGCISNTNQYKNIIQSNLYTLFEHKVDQKIQQAPI